MEPPSATSQLRNSKVATAVTGCPALGRTFPLYSYYSASNSVDLVGPYTREPTAVSSPGRRASHFRPGLPQAAGPSPRVDPQGVV